eukprot:5228938-Pleurochrysis_carterae.AAC.1
MRRSAQRSRLSGMPPLFASAVRCLAPAIVLLRGVAGRFPVSLFAGADDVALPLAAPAGAGAAAAEVAVLSITPPGGGTGGMGGAGARLHSNLRAEWQAFALRCRDSLKRLKRFIAANCEIDGTPPQSLLVGTAATMSSRIARQ